MTGVQVPPQQAANAGWAQVPQPQRMPHLRYPAPPCCAAWKRPTASSRLRGEAWSAGLHPRLHGGGPWQPRCRPESLRVQGCLVDNAGGNGNPRAVHHILGHDAAAPGWLLDGARAARNCSAGRVSGPPPQISKRRGRRPPSIRGTPKPRLGADQACSQVASTLSRDTRSWLMVSRSRMVTAWSSRVSKSTVMQNGVPISSWRR